jgi:hypothetical protein
MSWKKIPCNACNLLARDFGFTYEDLEQAGAIMNGKMVRHFNNCPLHENEAEKKQTTKRRNFLGKITRTFGHRE